MTTEIEIIDPKLDIILGESPHWDNNKNRLYWVDIEGKKLLSTDIYSHKTTYFDMPDMIGNAVPNHSGGFIVSLKNGIYHFNPSNQQFELLVPLETHKPNNRPNDGKCDPAGRMYIGTMDLQFKEGASSLYRIDRKDKCTPILQGLTLANGMAWDESKSIFYFIDSQARTIFSFDHDAESGNISNRKPAIEFDEKYGIPDGMCIDKEGMLWIAGFGGGNVIRFNPHTGKRLQRICIPAPNTTSVCFAGQDLTDLVITTATLLLSEEQRHQYPKSGCLFKLSCDTPGFPGVAFQDQL